MTRIPVTFVSEQLYNKAVGFNYIALGQTIISNLVMLPFFFFLHLYDLNGTPYRV